MNISRFNIYPLVNLVLTVILPVISMLTGNTTLFYIIYLYWWQEAIATVFDRIYFSSWRKKNPDAFMVNPFGVRLFMLAMYFVFIVVLFGFISNWGNSKLFVSNIMILLFKDQFFNVNLFLILLNEGWLRKKDAAPRIDTINPFSGRMIVMHISIILGAVMYFMVVKRLPQYFTDDNTSGMIVVSIPFFLLKMFVDRKLFFSKQLQEIT